MKEIKITEKTTKKSLVDYLKSETTKVTDKNLAERVVYALKMFGKDQTKVAKADLFELAQEVMKSLTPAPAPAPVEASLKPKKTGGITRAKKSSEPVEEAPAETEAETEEVEETEVETPVEKSEPKKSGKKSSLKKSEKSDKDSKKTAEKKTEVETLPAASNVGVDNLPSAKMFPAEIDHPELGKIVACTGAYTTYAEILKALEEEKTLYFACYWTKRQIREFQYAASKMIKPEVVKNGFPLDLDILMAVLPCETMERVFAMSRITEALFQFEGEDFKPVEDTDPRSGEKFQIRVSAGMEFEIYRPADEEVVTID
ncbi:MAG: hypothetical protein IKW20_06255 [Bacteroidales bacterium]|nr:hypothetical protein [Bacteroidales bacterium]